MTRIEWGNGWRRRTRLLAWIVALGWLAPGVAFGWSGHALGTWQALGAMPELTEQRVRAESLEAFIDRQAVALEPLLAEYETWARANLAYYPPRPDSLAFRAAQSSTGEGAPNARQRLLRALRLNPASKLPLFLEVPPDAGDAGPRALPWREVTALPSGVGARENRYVALDEGQQVSALDVVATASAEPDYGLDLGLFEDNGTAHGREYGFGAQPFGDAKVDYSSQAPFHMAFEHESWLLNRAAGFLRRTLPLARVALFSALARHAFASGHEYWGWRFTGWALHYVQDLTNPYHSALVPGVGDLRLIIVNLLAMTGFEGRKLDTIARVSNRHIVIENYAYKRVLAAYRDRRQDDAVLAALRDTGRDGEPARLTVDQVGKLVSREAREAADGLDAQIERSFPARLTSDPTVSLGMEADQLEMPGIARAHSAPEHQQLERQVVALMRRMGRHSRALVRALAPAVTPGAR